MVLKVLLARLRRVIGGALAGRAELSLKLPEGAEVDLEVVERAVAGHHRVRLPLVLRQQRVDREVEERFGALRHVEQALLQRLELLVEVPVRAGGLGGAHPNLPVM